MSHLEGEFHYFCGENISTPYVPAEHFWYMYMLLCVYLVFPLFKLAMEKDRKTGRYLFILLYILSCGFAESDQNLQASQAGSSVGGLAYASVPTLLWLSPEQERSCQHHPIQPCAHTSAGQARIGVVAAPGAT